MNIENQLQSRVLSEGYCVCVHVYICPKSRQYIGKSLKSVEVAENAVDNHAAPLPSFCWFVEEWNGLAWHGVEAKSNRSSFII